MACQIEQVIERRIWILTNGRLGDLKQMQILASHLGWPTEIKRISLRSKARLGIEALAPLLLDRSQSDRLAGPWPAIVVTAAASLTPIALWIRKRSGHRTKLIHIGRPAGSLRHFSLVVTSPQFLLQGTENIIQLPLPLTDAHQIGPTQSDCDTLDRLERLPKPRTAVLVGGRSPPHLFSASDARDLSRRVLQLVRRSGGSLLITTSPRTGKVVEAALFADVADIPCFFYKWSDQARIQNPYKTILHVADRFIVTCDSVSMIADAVATGKPTYVHDLPERPRLRDILVTWLSRHQSEISWWRFANPIRWLFSIGTLYTRADRRELLRQLRMEGVVQEWPPLHEDRPDDSVARYWAALRELTSQKE